MANLVKTLSLFADIHLKIIKIFLFQMKCVTFVNLNLALAFVEDLIKYSMRIHLLLFSCSLKKTVVL